MPDATNALIMLEGQKIPYRITQSKRAKRLRISVSAAGVTVTIPQGLRTKDAERFLQENAGWVLQQLTRLEKTRQKTVVLPADVILLRGIPTHIRVVEEADRLARVRVDAQGDRLVVRVPVGSKQSPRALVLPWLKTSAREEIESAVRQQSTRMGLRPKSISIRDQRTRWGSCSSKGTLSFNWRLVMTPPAVLEYVVIHELAHMKHPNHSSDFWVYVGKYYPDYKSARQWMKKNASALRPGDL